MLKRQERTNGGTSGWERWEKKHDPCVENEDFGFSGFEVSSLVRTDDPTTILEASSFVWPASVSDAFHFLPWLSFPLFLFIIRV